MNFCHALVFAAALAIASPATAGPTQAPLEAVSTMRLEGWVIIDTSGHVVEHAITTPVDDALLASLDRNVTQWRFAPVVIHGAPVLAKADFRLTLAARPLADRVEVRVDNVLFPDPAQEAKAAVPFKDRPAEERATLRIKPESLMPPRYPPNLQRAGIPGRVLVALRLNQDGSVAQAQAVQTVLFDVRGRDSTMREAAHEFELASLAAARRWRFDVQLKDATPSVADLTATVPITFTLDSPPVPSGQWRAELRGARSDISWLPAQPGRVAAGASDVESSQPMPVASNVELKDGAIGQVLL